MIHNICVEYSWSFCSIKVRIHITVYDFDINEYSMIQGSEFEFEGFSFDSIWYVFCCVVLFCHSLRSPLLRFSRRKRRRCRKEVRLDWHLLGYWLLVLRVLASGLMGYHNWLGLGYLSKHQKHFNQFCIQLHVWRLPQQNLSQNLDLTIKHLNCENISDHISTTWFQVALFSL